MATYNFAFPDVAIDAILTTAYHLQQAGYIFRGSASDYSGTPTEREWVIAPAGFTGLGLSSAVPQGSIGVCLYTGTAWVGKVINVLTLDSAPTRNSQNGVTSGGVAATLDEIAGGIMATFASLLFDDETAAGDLSTKLSYAVKFSVSDVYQTVTHLNILAATASKAGLLSAADKAKLDALWSSGYQFAGIATPSTTPVSTTSKIFYIATEAGTYFNTVTVTQGINIIYKSGDTWSVAQVVGIDDEPTAGSDNLVKSGGVKETVSGLQKEIGGDVDIELHPIYIEGYYISPSGAKVPHSTDAISNPYHVSKGDRVSCKSKAFNNVSIISITNESASYYIPVVIGSGSAGNIQTVEYEATEDCYLCFCSIDEPPTVKLIHSAGVIQEVEDLEETVGMQQTVDMALSGITGYYIDRWGRKIQHSTDFVSNPIPVESGDIISYTGKGISNVAMISVTDESGSTYIPVVLGQDGQPGNMQTVSYSVPNNCYLALSSLDSVGVATKTFSNGLIKEVIQLDDKFNDLNEKIGIYNSSTVALSGVSGYYIDRRGRKIQHNTDFISNPLFIKAGDIISYTGKGISNVAMISITDSEGTFYTPVVLGENGHTGNMQTATYQALKDCYVALCSLDTQGSCSLKEPSGLIKEVAGIKGDVEEINEVLKDDFNILTTFNNLVCVGDSLTASLVYVSSVASESRPAYRTYPEVLSGLCGNESVTLGQGGASAQMAWNLFKDDIISKTNPLGIVYLGTNGGITDTLDIDVVGDVPDNWADNNIGCYCRIVAKMLSLNYRVLLIKPWTSSGTGSANLANTQSAIQHVADRFGCSVIGPFKNDAPLYHLWPNKQGSNDVHYNDAGYAWFANTLIQKVYELSDVEKLSLIPL